MSPILIYAWLDDPRACAAIDPLKRSFIDSRMAQVLLETIPFGFIQPFYVSFVPSVLTLACRSELVRNPVEMCQHFSRAGSE